MAGIYIHIPFCRKACHYCNFHFSTSQRYQNEVVDAILLELELRQSYLNQAPIDTIYFGGGTPSLLPSAQIIAILKKINHHYKISPDAEITLEANPEDLTSQKLTELQAAGVNRLSIGVQSFIDRELEMMNRNHSAATALQAIQQAQKSGISNITIDLIFGIPGTTMKEWEQNISEALALNVPHISCYNLTVEPKTALEYMVSTGKIAPPDEDISAAQYEHLISRLEDRGFIHYEISNFGKEGYFSRHNSSYWQGKHYLGIGPSAHSFNGKERQWNIANNARYIKALAERRLAFEKEELSKTDQMNERIMTGLRTWWGIDLSQFEKDFGAAARSKLEKEAAAFIQKDWISSQENKLRLTRSGKLLADHIMADLFH